MVISVLTPDRSVFEGEIQSVKVPGVSGEFEILKGHAALVSALKNGAVRIIEQNGTKKTFDIEKGFIEVLNDNVSLLVQGLTKEQ